MRRRGLGLQTKEHILARAQSAGALVVASKVHYDNEAMISLNHEKLGAEVAVERPYGHYVICTIRVG